MWVVKHFPLRMHPHAPAAAVAAECAGDQGKFWVMHHALFERMEEWSGVNDADAALAKIAANLGLESKRFTACLESRKTLERVLRDMYDGQAIGIKSMPTFILFHDGTGHLMTGARSSEQFAATLQQQLENAEIATEAGWPGGESVIVRRSNGVFRTPAVEMTFYCTVKFVAALRDSALASAS